MRSYLIVGNQTLMGPELDAAIAARMVPGDPPDLHVVVPATPRPGAFTWNEDEATADAQGRLDAMLEHLKGLGLQRDGGGGLSRPGRGRSRRPPKPPRRGDHPVDAADRDLALARPGCPEPAQVRGERAGRRRDRRARSDRDQERLTSATGYIAGMSTDPSRAPG